MHLEQEALIAEILGTSPSGDYCHWPRTAAGPPGSPEIATIKSRLRRISDAGDYDRLARYMEEEPTPSMAVWPSSPAPGSSMSRAALVIWRLLQAAMAWTRRAST